jgi:hypothetical protein
MKKNILLILGLLGASEAGITMDKGQYHKHDPVNIK